MKRSKPVHGSGNGALTPDYSKPHQADHISKWHQRAEQAKSDPIHVALSVSLLESKREIAGRDRKIGALEATIRELRTRIRFLENASKLTAGQR